MILTKSEVRFWGTPVKFAAIVLERLKSWSLFLVASMQIVFTPSATALEDNGSTHSSWNYDYKSSISKKSGTVKFFLSKDSQNNSIEKVIYSIKNNRLLDESFEYERQPPYGNIVVDAINPISRKTYHEFSPYLLAGGTKHQNLDLSKLKVSTQHFTYLHDNAWVFHGSYVNTEQIIFDGKVLTADKFRFSGRRPTDMQHCIEGQEGKIVSEVWFVPGIDRYVKQIVNTYHCEIAGQGFHLDEETYTLKNLPNYE